MQIEKTRWSKVYESSEEELTTLLKNRNIAAERLVLEAGEAVKIQQYASDTRLWCAEGSINYFYDNKKLSVQVGDSVVIPEGLEFNAIAGMAGCIYYSSAASKSLISK